MCKILLDEAKRALVAHGHKLLIENISFDYVAIVKKEDDSFKFEIGINSDEICIKNSIDPQFVCPKIKTKRNIIKEILKGNLITNEIPIPKKRYSNKRIKKYSPYKYEDKYIEVRFKKSSKLHIKEPSYSTSKIKKNERSFSISEADNNLKIQGGNCIGNLFSKGTLGMIFQLEGFDNMYFALSNAHVLSTKQQQKKDTKIYILENEDSDHRNTVIGNLFWEDYSCKRDAAFMLFDKNFNDKLLAKMKCGHNLQPIIRLPEFNEEVKICGCASYNMIRSNQIVLSTDAHVRINKNSDQKIFTHQILTQRVSVNRDSGSALLSIDNSVIGLIFAETNGGKGDISVANNLSYIFDHKFKKSQEIYINGKVITYNKKFKIKNILNN